MLLVEIKLDAQLANLRKVQVKNRTAHRDTGAFGVTDKPPSQLFICPGSFWKLPGEMPLPTLPFCLCSFHAKEHCKFKSKPQNQEGRVNYLGHLPPGRAIQLSF